MFAEKITVLECFLQFCATAEDQGGSAIYRLDVQGRIALWKLFRPKSASSDARFADAVAIGFFVELLKQAMAEAYRVSDVVAVTSDQSLIPDDLLPKTSVLHGSEGMTLRFPARWLAGTIGTMQPAAGVCPANLSKYQPEDIPTRVREVVRQRISDPGFNLEELANTMGLKPWNLQRELKAAGTSFHRIRNDICKEVAIEQVEAGSEPIADIAASLGYSTASNFSRAFRKWTGATPRRFCSERNPGSVEAERQ
ncbi:MAG: AraC family transcriptional regulator [Paracoccaceae bacterium]|nr:AraC family transcriptional regulator [Paracoccaceae bacterium]